MHCVIFTHSLVSDWNHGNAHFVRGIASELMSRGFRVRIFEPWAGWSRRNLVLEQGGSAIEDFKRAYPSLRSSFYHPETIDLDQGLKDADVVLVHEWNDYGLVRRLGEHHATHREYKLFFHDTHHRSVTDSDSIAAYDLQHYDGVLAYGNVIRDRYLQGNRVRGAWTWHEAADTRVFKPLPKSEPEGDLVWIGNWGDEERSAELQEFLIDPVQRLKLKACVYGVRYSASAREALACAGIEYKGWLPNYRVPEVFSRYRVTIHVPRRPYSTVLPGIPTIRPFEALACGIPLVSAPWKDSEDLFRPGQDFVYAKDGEEMRSQLQLILSDQAFAERLAGNGLQTIQRRHTCAHRADELSSIVNNLSRRPQLTRRAS